MGAKKTPSPARARISGVQDAAAACPVRPGTIPVPAAEALVVLPGRGDLQAATPLLRASGVGFAAGIVLLALGIVRPLDIPWFTAHGAMMLAGFLLPLLAYLHIHSLHRFAGTGPSARDVRILARALLAAAGVLGLAYLLQGDLFGLVALAGWGMFLAAGVQMMRLVLPHVPRTSVVNVAQDPLTKGDDACWKHVRFAHFFLPLGLALVFLAYVPGLDGVPGFGRVELAGIHLLLAGYGLLSIYGIGHLWVPRFSGVPAIAAGAIKGELHTSLLGLVGITFGFLFDIRGLLVGLGPFLFLGFFTYMGVLGANIMRNKSVTQRVTPEFVYVPWTFAGVFWLISGVLLGIFLNVIPEQLEHLRASLYWIHIHINLFGGFTILGLGWLTRILSERTERTPAFAGAMKSAFYLLNAALVVGLLGHIADGARGTPMAAAAGLAAAGALLFVAAMRGFITARDPASA